MTQEEFTKSEIKEALNELIEKGYLKQIGQKYIDSDKVTSLLKEGKSREEIAQLLEKEYSKRCYIGNNRHI